MKANQNVIFQAQKRSFCIKAQHARDIRDPRGRELVRPVTTLLQASRGKGAGTSCVGPQAPSPPPLTGPEQQHRWQPPAPRGTAPGWDAAPAAGAGLPVWDSSYTEMPCTWHWSSSDAFGQGTINPSANYRLRLNEILRQCQPFLWSIWHTTNAAITPKPDSLH